jgi:hypothetical protein
VNGSPLFKVSAETVTEPERHNVYHFWLSILLFLAGTLLLLSVWPKIPYAIVAGVVQTLFIGGLLLYGRRLGQASQLFSPLLYADGPFLYSLGAVVLINLLITVVLISLYIVRSDLPFGGTAAISRMCRRLSPSWGFSFSLPASASISITPSGASSSTPASAWNCSR